MQLARQRPSTTWRDDLRVVRLSRQSCPCPASAPNRKNRFPLHLLLTNGAVAPEAWDDTEVIPPVGTRGAPIAQWARQRASLTWRDDLRVVRLSRQSRPCPYPSSPRKNPQKKTAPCKGGLFVREGNRISVSRTGTACGHRADRAFCVPSCADRVSAGLPA